MALLNQDMNRSLNLLKALSWAFVDRLNPDDVRIAAVEMGQRTPQEVEYIETRMIQSARPSYNTRMK